MLIPLALRAPALLLLASGLQAQAPTPPRSDTSRSAGVPVVVGTDTLFRVRERLGPFSAEERAAAVQSRVERLTHDPVRQSEQVRISRGESASDVLVGDQVVLTVTEADARAAGTTRDELARRDAMALSRALRQHGLAARLRMIGMGALFALLTALATLLIFRLLNRVFPRLLEGIHQGRTTWIRPVRVQRVELVSANQLADGLLWLAKVARVLLTVLLLYISIPVILSFFPWTRSYADQLFGYILTPFASIWASLIAYLPNVFKLGAIAVVTWYLLKLIRVVFVGFARGNIRMSGFYPDWAIPTYKLVRTLVLLFALIAAWPYLPGSDSEAFRGVGVFVGLLLSLGSASAVGNMVGGVVLTYMRPFRVGDRVRISDTEGDVVEKSLLVTRIRTIKNVDVTIPNSMILSSHIINYSSSARSQGLVLNTGVTIGYDVPWRQVHELLLGAARATPGIDAEPPPFVLQTSLDDFYVSYQLNAYTREPNRMAAMYSALHANIQDRFNEAGVEIMSPHYRAQRDGSHVTVPAQYLPADYRAPGFRLEIADTGATPGPAGS